MSARKIKRSLRGGYLKGYVSFWKGQPAPIAWQYRRWNQ